MAPAPTILRGSTYRGSHAVVPTPPLEIGHRRQLLMDDCVVADRWRLRRTVHQPVKHESNPLISPQRPCEARGPAYITAFLDPHTGQYRLWGTVSGEGKGELARRGVYYESDDGLDWSAPDLGLVEFEGSSANNIFWGGGGFIYDNLNVLPLPEAHAGKGRYAMLYNRSPAGGGDYDVEPAAGMQVRLAFSDDGLRWRDQDENPVLVGRSDTHNNMVYNPQRGAFMHYRRATINAHEIRRIALSESADLVEWTQPRVVLAPDELDPPMLYSMTVHEYEGLYLGFVQMFYAGAEQRLDKELMTDCQLAWSRDGQTWERHPERPLFQECGHVGDWDWGMVRPGQSLVTHGDEVRIYYAGADRLHTRMEGEWRVGLATLRRDGFVSLEAQDEGYMVTRPLRCPAGRLHLNLRTGCRGSGRDGFVRVAVRRADGVADGEMVPGRDFESAAPVTGDCLDAVAGWSGQEDLSALEGQAVRLHFWLKDAELYSFWIA